VWGSGCRVEVNGSRRAERFSCGGSPRLLKLTEVPLLLKDVPLSNFVSVGSMGTYSTQTDRSLNCQLASAKEQEARVEGTNDDHRRNHRHDRATQVLRQTLKHGLLRRKRQGLAAQS